MKFKDEYILCAAIYIKDNNKHVHQPKNITIGFVVCGRRHHNCFTTLALMNIKPSQYPLIQGFITNQDNFLDRRDSANIAYRAKQIIESSDTLISEDLY